MTRIILLVAGLTALAACEPGGTYTNGNSTSYGSSDY